MENGMDDLFEDNESEPYHFIVLDSQDTENIPPPSSWDDTSILKSLPALRIPETQYELDLTTIPDSQLSPIHSFHVSETLLFDTELVDSCSFNPVKLRRKIMDDQHVIVIDETSSHGSSTSESSENFGRSLSQSMIENPTFDKNPKFLPSSKDSDKKVLSVKQCKDSRDTKTSKEIPSTSFPQKMSQTPNVTVLARQSLFKNYQEDTESDEKETHPMVCTPSTHIASLQFSQESMLVPDTADEMNYIEPSPEHNPTPTIIPDSPTLSLSEESDDDTQDPTMIEASILRQKKTPENLDTTIEHVADDSIKESQSFQLLYMDTQASQMSQVARSGSPEKSMIIEASKRETEHSHHDNSDISSESEDFNLHLSFNTQNESFKDATSQRSSFSGKMSISQSPATPKDNSNEEVKFKLILPSSAQSLSKGSKDEESPSTSSHKPHLIETVGPSQQEVSQRMSPVQYKVKSQEKVTDLKIVQSQEEEGHSVMKGSQQIHSPDVLPDSQENDSTVAFTTFHKVRSKDIKSSSETRDSPVEPEKAFSQKEDSHVESQKSVPSSQKEDSHVESQKGYSQKSVPSSQKADSNVESQKEYSQKSVPSSQKEDSHVESQKGYSQKSVPSSQKADSNVKSQKGYSQKSVPSSQKEDSNVESQKGYSQKSVPSSQKADSNVESQKGYSQKSVPSSQKEDSNVESQKGYSQKSVPSSQKEDSHVEPQNGYSQKSVPSSQKEDSHVESQKGYSQKSVPSSQKADSNVESQKGYSQKSVPSSQKEDSHVESQKGYSQKSVPSSQKEDSNVESQKGYSQRRVPSSQKEDSEAESQKGYSQKSVPSSQKADSNVESQKGYSQKRVPNSQKEDSHVESKKEYPQKKEPSSQKEDSHVKSQEDNSLNIAPSSQKGHSSESQKAHSPNVAPTSQKGESQKVSTPKMFPSSQKEDFHVESQKGYSQNLTPGSQEICSLTAQSIVPSSQKEDFHVEYQKGSQNVAASSHEVHSLAESQKDYSQNIILGSQKEDSPAESQKSNFQNVTPSSQKDFLGESQKVCSQNMVPSSPKEGTSACSQKDYLQDKNSQSRNTKEKSSDSQKKISENIPTSSQQGHSHCMMPASQEQENPAPSYGFQVVKKKEGNSGISQRETFEDFSTDSKKKNTQDMSEHSQNKDSQEMMLLSQREQLEEEKSSNSQKESLSSLAQRERSQTGSQTGNSEDVMSPSQKEESPNHSSQCQKGDSQDLLLGSQREDLPGKAANLSDVSADYQKGNSENSIPTKGGSQDMSCSLPKGSSSLSEKEKTLGKNSEKVDSQDTLSGSQKNGTSASQVKNSNLQAGSQSQIIPHGFCKEKILDLSVRSQERKSQSAMSNIIQDAEISKADSQSRISMDSSNVLVTEINVASPDKDKRSIKSTSQKLSHSQPSELEVSGLYDSDMKRCSPSQDSGLTHLANLKPLACSSQKYILERPSPTDQATQDPCNNLPISKEPTSVDTQNPNRNPEKLIAIPLGSVSNFQGVCSLSEQRDSCLSQPVMVLSQERDLRFQNKEGVSTSQPPPSTLKRKYSERAYQSKPSISKNYVSEETLPFSSSAKLETQEQQKELKPSVSQEPSSLKNLSPPDSERQDVGNDSLKDKEFSQKNASPEKMEVDFVVTELPSKPNVCYLKDSQHSQGSSTITLSQNHQFEIYMSQAEASEKVHENSKEVSNSSVQAAHDKNVVINPNPNPSKTVTTAANSLTMIKPKDKRRISEISEASSTMYPSQTSTSQQRHTSSHAVQPRHHTAISSIARYNIIGSRKPESKTEPPPPMAGPSNDPYLFISSQPKIIQTVESRKKQRKSKRTQKKTIPKKKSSLSGRSWAIRKDYKSPIHRVRFEPVRRRIPSLKLLKDDPIFLKVPSHKDIETIFTKKDQQKEQVKSSCSSDGSMQPSDNKTDQKQQALFSNLQNVLQRKIVEETVVQLVYRKTTIETVKNSKVVGSRTIVEKEEPVIIRRTRNEDFKYLNSAKGVSPFCSPSSLTSGEYADVSSLSHSDSKTSNSSSFGSLTTKQSRSEMPVSSLVQYTATPAKKGNQNGPQVGQPVTLRQMQSPGTDDDLMKAPSPITSVYKDAHSVYCSTEELHAVNQSCEDGRPYVTGTAPRLVESSDDPAKSRATVVQGSDSLFSSNENLNISDSGPPGTMAEQGTVVEKTGQSSVDSLVQEADQNITLHVESAETSEIDLKTPPPSQKRSSPQKRKVSHFEENSEETGPDELPPQKRMRKDSEDGNGSQQTKTSEECGSPEISQQNFRQQIKMPSLSPESSRNQKTGIGLKVMAKWKDGYFYPGITSSLEKGGKCLINFADGDQLWVKINQILIVNYLPQGQTVLVQSKDNFFDSGMIVDHIESGGDSVDSFAYRIEMDDKTTVDCTRQKVILTEAQAANLLSDEEYQMICTVPSTPQPTGADVSLDNLVDGCRRSAKKESEVSSEKMESRSGKRTRLMKMEPQAMSTPTPKRKTKGFKKGFMAHLNLVPTAESWSSDKKLKLCNSNYAENLIGAAVSSPKSQKYDKSRHVKKELFDAIKGPIPAQKNLFKGMNFLLTHTEKNAEQKLMDKKMIQDFSSESSTNVCYSDGDEPEVPFDKHHLQAQIEAGGGTVFDSWSDKFITKKAKSLIISSSYQRTIKYLQGLAAGIPCVSFLWIRDCCKQGVLCDYKSYMLQAGISLKNKCLLECKLKPRCMDDTQVLVYSTNSDFVSTWSEILVLAGCNVVKKFKKTRDQSRDVEFVIADKTCSAHIKKQAEIYNSPLLSTEWIIQCLIHGQKLCYTGHEKYKYDYEEEK